VVDVELADIEVLMFDVRLEVFGGFLFVEIRGS